MLSKKIVKYIQSLTHKKERRDQACFVAEGQKIVEEFLGEGIFSCELICAEKDWLDNHKSILYNIPDMDVHVVDLTDLKRISLLKMPNGVLGVFRKKISYALPEISGKLTLMLDGLQDPGNLGTIIRIADWFGIENLICSESSVDCYNPKVVQSAMGSLGRVNVMYTSLASFIERNPAIPVYAATLDGMSIQKISKFNEGILLIGNESNGIGEELMNKANKRITIPRIGKAESLNAAVATGIILGQLKFC
jgi:RNA methyltransferase, TrmH family